MIYKQQENIQKTEQNNTDLIDRASTTIESTRLVRKKVKATDSHLRLQAFLNSEEAKKYLQK